MSRLIRRLSLYYLIALFFFGWGLAVGIFHVFPWSLIKGVRQEIAEFVSGDPYDRSSSLLERIFEHPLMNDQARFAGHDGFVTGDPDFIDDGYLLLSRYSDVHEQSVAELVRLSDRRTIHVWKPDIEAIARLSRSDLSGPKQRNTVYRYKVGHPLMLPDGGLVFHNFEGPMVRIDACSRIRWVLDDHFHHSIEPGPDGTIWTSSVIKPSSLATGQRDDAIANVSLDGELLSRTSISRMLDENGYRGLMYGIGAEPDPIHMNDVQPVAGPVPGGPPDLLLSMRHRSTVARYRPATNSIVWLKTGPWLNQHDVNDLGGGKVSVFGNDMIRYSANHPEGYMFYDDISQVYVFDPAMGQVSTPYDAMLRRLEVRTVSQGRSRILGNGDVFIEEQNSRRLLRLSADRLRWSYVNRMRDGKVGSLNWSRYLHSQEAAAALSSLKGVSC